jgi:dipeptidyl aminopeptidase/acylaminoacyl peptidase
LADLPGLRRLIVISIRVFRLSLLSLLLSILAIATGGFSSELEQIPVAEMQSSVQARGDADSTIAWPEDNSNGTKLIPRELFFGNPDKYRILNSLDGKWISYMAPYNGVLNVWVAPLYNLSAAKPVTNDSVRGIQNYIWANTDRHILYIQDSDGDENWTIYSVDVITDERRNLTPLEDVNAQLLSTSIKIPQEVLIGLNDRDPSYHDIYRFNITTGEKKLVQRNEGFSYFVEDHNFKIRFAGNATADGSEEIFKRLDNGSWALFMKKDANDDFTTGILGFDVNDTIMYMIDSRGRETTALTATNMTSGNVDVLLDDLPADIDAYIVHPATGLIRAVAYTYDRRKWVILNASIEPDLELLRNKFPDRDMNVYHYTLDDKNWFFSITQDIGPAHHYHYNRSTGEVRFLFSEREDLDNLTLAKMHPVVINSSDGLRLVSYYSLPVWSDEDGNGLPEKPMPMVLLVHGGPWSRDYWGFNNLHQLLANRGYAVMSVNYRGSTGFGKSFINAGNRQWGAKMHDDLIDAVNWSIERGIADPDRIAIMGGSYGGYAALAGLTFTPEVFACGVDICGISNLTSFLRSVPPYWLPEIQKEFLRVGDYRTEEERAFLRERSPLTYVDRIHRPLLISQGANDPRVKQNESDQIVLAMQAKSIPVTYLLYPDEGHGFVRSENKLSFYAVAEAFLAKHLGGRYESVGTAFKNSSITVPTGADGVLGLAEALHN